MRFRFKLSYLSIGLLVLIISMSFFTPRTNAYSQGDISINVNPQNPSPNKNTTITLSSYAYDLNSILITWSVGGKRASSGIGQKFFSVTAPTLGKQTTVTATIALPDGDVNQTVTIRPSIMTLLWQANDSYVPAFYKGKALPSPNSEVKIVAVPEIKNSSGFIDPKNMLYAWKLNSTNDQDSSGYGKNSFVYTSDYLDSSNLVSVTASTIDQSYSADGNINVQTTDPKIEFYKNDLNIGTIWEQTLGDGHKITGNEIIQAIPYFISPKDIRIPFLTFTWSINGQQVTVPSYSKNLLPLTLQAGTSGTAKIGLQVDNVNNLVETANKEINVQF